MTCTLRRSLLLLLILGSPLLAQQGDRMVSVEPMTRELPEEIRIQSAASISNVTLALWGANLPEGTDSAVSTLVFQMLRDSVALGTPLQAHSAEARPSRFCTVIPFDDRFLLLWNDRRIGAPGIYARWVDAGGGFIGDEELFSRGVIVDPNGIRTYRTTAGVMVIWSDFRDSVQGLYLKRMTSDGAFAEQEQRIGEGKIEAVVGLGDLVELTGIREGTVMRVLRPDGRFDARTIPAGRFTGGYYLGTDSSMAVLKDTILTFYASMFDTMAARSVIVPLLRGIPPLTAALTRDISGGIAITYSFAITAAPGTSGAMIVNRVVVEASAGVARRLDSVYFFNYSQVSQTRTEVKPAVVVRGCGNGIRLYQNILFLNVDRTGFAYGSHSQDWSYNIGSDGAYSRINPITPVAPCFTIDGANGLRPILRRGSKDTGIVELFLPGVTRVLRGSVNSYRQDVVQSMPNIFRRNQDLVVTWLQPGTAAPNVLARWNPANNSTVISATSTLVGNHLRMMNTTAVVRNEHWVYHGTTLEDFGRITIQIVDSQWTQRVMDEYGSPYSQSWSVSDPNRNESIVFRLARESSYALQGVWTDSNGFPRQSISARLHNIAFMLDSTTIVVYSPQVARRFYHMRGGTYVDSFDVERELWSRTPFRRLYGPRFLNITVSDSLLDARLEIFSLRGVREVGGVMQGSRGYRDPVIVESPIDSSIHIIWTADDGIRLTRLDRYLNIAVRDSLISSGPGKLNPAAVFRHDTLFVVWQEERNGPSDIYATTWTAPLLRGTPPRVEDTSSSPDTPEPLPTTAVTGHTAMVAISAITPNPADQIATLFIELAEPADAVAEILDMTGQVLIRRQKRFDRDSGRWDIDISDLTSGLYIIAVHADGDVALTKLLVMQTR